jgi:hypothetical protein
MATHDCGDRTDRLFVFRPLLVCLDAFKIYNQESIL